MAADNLEARYWVFSYFFPSEKGTNSTTIPGKVVSLATLKLRPFVNFPQFGKTCGTQTVLTLTDGMEVRWGGV